MRRPAEKTNHQKQWYNEEECNPPDSTRGWTGRVKPMFSNSIGEGVISHHCAVCGGAGRAIKSGFGGRPKGSSCCQSDLSEKKSRDNEMDEPGH